VKAEALNRYWEKIVNTMNDGLFVVGPDGKITIVNHALESLLGYKAHELVGRPCTMLYSDACDTTLRKNNDRWWCTLFETGEESRTRCLFMKKDGSYVSVLKNATILNDEKGVVLGAVETITDISELERLDREVDRLARQLDSRDGFHCIIGESSAMQRVFQVIEKAAKSEAPVAIYGESGTGKELVAQAIHKLGDRRKGPFLQLNCSALNEALLESELFGHVKGAFTGAYRHRIGRFEAAHGGDIFLDEIGDLPESIQVKLLRVLETKRFERVGDQTTIGVDVRIITATNKNLNELIARKEFREDLFFRINVIPIYIPPLRERLDDIPLLVHAFVKRLRTKTGKAITGLSGAAMERLTNYSWPGNVRELKSSLEYAFVLCEQGVIAPSQLPPHIADNLCENEMFPTPRVHGKTEGKEALISALQQCGGNQSRAAKVLGISRGTVWNRMKKYGINLKKVMIASSGGDHPMD
jgi:two-component system response regulator HydG